MSNCVFNDSLMCCFMSSKGLSFEKLAEINFSFRSLQIFSAETIETSASRSESSNSSKKSEISFSESVILLVKILLTEVINDFFISVVFLTVKSSCGSVDSGFGVGCSISETTGSGSTEVGCGISSSVGLTLGFGLKISKIECLSFFGTSGAGYLTSGSETLTSGFSRTGCLTSGLTSGSSKTGSGTLTSGCPRISASSVVWLSVAFSSLSASFVNSWTYLDSATSGVGV